MQDRSQYLNIAQACALARVSRRTIYNWIARGLVVKVTTASGQPRILASSLFREPTPAPAE